MTIKPVVDNLFPYAYSIVSEDSDRAVDAYLKELPFEVYKYPSGAQLNGWFIPNSWRVDRAEIRKDGELIYDGRISPLGVGVLSPSFKGSLSLEELKPHLVYSETLDEAIVYHWSNLYRPNDLDWYFCMPKSLVDQLSEGIYEIDLKTSTQPGTMKVYDYVLKGDTDETVLLNGHNCHPYQANDDLSGVAVAIEVVKCLAKKTNRRLTYRVLIAPELHGPMFWLQEGGAELYQDIKAAILFKSVGNDAPLRLQYSYEGDTAIDRASLKVFERRYGEFDSGAFRAIYGNDETVFDTPPYNIPTVSLTRWPFAEYHTDQDTPDRLDEERLDDCVKAALEICKNLENLSFDMRFKRQFEGLVCLSAYGLYKSIPPVSEDGVDYSSLAGRWNRLMNCLPNEIDKGKTVSQLADRFELPVEEVHIYLMEWVECGLLTLEGGKP